MQVTKKRSKYTHLHSAVFLICLSLYCFALPPWIITGKKSPYYGLKFSRELTFCYIPDSTAYIQELSKIIQVSYNSSGGITDSSVQAPNGVTRSVTSYLYDRSGILFEASHYENSILPAWRQLYLFNARNQCLQISRSDSIGRTTRVKNFYYNEYGNIDAVHTFNSIDSTGIKKVIHYDDNEQVIENRWYDHENKLLRKSEFGKDGNLTGTIRYDSDRTPDWKYVHSMLTKSGQKEIQFRVSGEKEWVTSFNHDAVKKITEMQSYGESGELLFRIVLKYDEKNNYTDIIEFDCKNRLVARSEFRYDGKGRIVSEKSFITHYSTGEAVEIPHQLKVYEYENYPGLWLN